MTLLIPSRNFALQILLRLSMIAQIRADLHHTLPEFLPLFLLHGLREHYTAGPVGLVVLIRLLGFPLLLI
jgi:hypothetical protein